jgi:hypothetical protein
MVKKHPPARSLAQKSVFSDRDPVDRRAVEQRRYLVHLLAMHTGHGFYPALDHRPGPVTGTACDPVHHRTRRAGKGDRGPVVGRVAIFFKNKLAKKKRVCCNFEAENTLTPTRARWGWIPCPPGVFGICHA